MVPEAGNLPLPTARYLRLFRGLESPPPRPAPEQLHSMGKVTITSSSHLSSEKNLAFLIHEPQLLFLLIVTFLLCVHLDWCGVEFTCMFTFHLVTFLIIPSTDLSLKIVGKHDEEAKPSRKVASASPPWAFLSRRMTAVTPLLAWVNCSWNFSENDQKHSFFCCTAILPVGTSFWR